MRRERLPKIVRAIAWKAGVRLCARYRRLVAVGKRRTLVTTAIAREMAAFLWAIGHEVVPSCSSIRSNEVTFITESQISCILPLRSTGGGASVGNPRMNWLADDLH